MFGQIITYALKDNKIVHISEVKSGISSGCFCVKCKSRLSAKKGDIYAHHFAHYQTKECFGAYKTSLLHGAKTELEKCKRFTIPRGVITFDSGKEGEVIFEAKEIHIDNVYLDKNIGDVVPDILIETEGKSLAIELYVSYRIDIKKRNLYEKYGISIVEIDLSEITLTQNPYDLIELVINSVNNKEWQFNRVINHYKKQFEKFAYPIPRSRFFEGFVCPINMFNWKGESAVPSQYCKYCEFCYSFSPMLCMGKSYISKLSDLKKDKQIREQEWKAKREDQLKFRIVHNKCPQCYGGKLVNEQGLDGGYLGCSNHPNCDFKIDKNRRFELFL